MKREAEQAKRVEALFKGFEDCLSEKIHQSIHQGLDELKQGAVRLKQGLEKKASMEEGFKRTDKEFQQIIDDMMQYQVKENF